MSMTTEGHLPLVRCTGELFGDLRKLSMGTGREDHLHRPQRLSMAVHVCQYGAQDSKRFSRPSGRLEQYVATLHYNHWVISACTKRVQSVL